jgi:hypothetical protein
MIELALAGMALATSTGVGAAVWYKLGKVESKVDFIYKNIDVCMEFKKQTP